MRIPSTLSIAFVALSTLGAPLQTHAAWTPDGIVLVEYYQGVYPYLMEARPEGGLLVRVPYRAFQSSVLTDRIDASGSISWSREGSPGSGTFDGQGGVYGVINTGGSGVWAASRITPAGVTWPYGGVALFPDDGNPVPTAPDGGGGLYAAHATSNSLKLKRLLADGTFAAGWPAAGVELSLSTSYWPLDPKLLSDGSGGVLVGWTSHEGSFFWSQVERVDANGTKYFWGAYATDDFISQKEVVALVPSGQDHFFYCFRQYFWSPEMQTYLYDVRLQRIAKLDGSTDPGWPAVGILLLGGRPYDFTFDVMSDDDDGFLMAWRDGPTVKGLRFLSDGTLATGWPAAGLSLLDAAAILPPASSTWRDYHVAAHAGAPVIAWTDQRDGASRVRARWLLADGSPDPQQPESGRVVSAPGVDLAYVLGMTSDGNGGLYVGWLHDRWGPPLWEYHRYMVSWAPYQDVLAVPPPRAATLELGTPWPNPARRELNLRFALGDDSPARLELIDVAGHRVRSMDVHGAGEHVKRFERLDALSAGVYFVRLTHRGRTSTSRVALVH